jgi:hypothetical protein
VGRPGGLRRRSRSSPAAGRRARDSSSEDSASEKGRQKSFADASTQCRCSEFGLCASTEAVAQPAADTTSAYEQGRADSAGSPDEIFGFYGKEASGSTPQAAGGCSDSGFCASTEAFAQPAADTTSAIEQGWADTAAVVAGSACERIAEQQFDEHDSDDVFPQLVQDDWLGYESTDSDGIGVGRLCLSFDAAVVLPFPFELQRGRGIEPAALKKFEGILQRSTCWWRTDDTSTEGFDVGGGTANTSTVGFDDGGGTADTSKGVPRCQKAAGGLGRACCLLPFPCKVPRYQKAAGELG